MTPGCIDNLCFIPSLTAQSYSTCLHSKPLCLPQKQTSSSLHNELLAQGGLVAAVTHVAPVDISHFPYSASSDATSLDKSDSELQECSDSVLTYDPSLLPPCSVFDWCRGKGSVSYDPTLK